MFFAIPGIGQKSAVRIEVMLGWGWSDVVECRGVHLDFFLPASYPRLRVSPPFPYMTQPQTRNLETEHLSKY